MMKFEDFHIGLEFCDGHMWYRCTDIGTRSILGVCVVDTQKLSRIDERLIEQSEFCLEEKVFTQKDLQRCYVEWESHIVSLIEEKQKETLLIANCILVKHNTDYIKLKWKFRNRYFSKKYPHQKVLSHSRLQGIYELSPLGAFMKDKKWWITAMKEDQVLEISENDWLDLPIFSQE